MKFLQDFAKNLKELDIKQWKFNFSEIWENAKHKTKTGENLSRVGVEEVDNRWGSIYNDYYKKLFDEKPEKFKKFHNSIISDIFSALLYLIAYSITHSM